jgi:hypothetical protein
MLHNGRHAAENALAFTAENGCMEETMNSVQETTLFQNSNRYF